MTQPMRPLRIAVADDERDTREYFKELLVRMGHQVVGAAANARELVEQCRAEHPDLVITDIRMPDRDGIDAATEINRDRQVPVILVSAHHDAELMIRSGQDFVMAYLIKPVKEAELKTAIYLAMLRFEHFQKLVQEAASLRQALEDRKVIERAKGMIMKRARLDEPEAFRRLQRLASDRNLKLVEFAQMIVTADEAFQPSSPVPLSSRKGEGVHH
jgi:response regulator NasT